MEDQPAEHMVSTAEKSNSVAEPSFKKQQKRRRESEPDEEEKAPLAPEYPHSQARAPRTLRIKVTSGVPRRSMRVKISAARRIYIARMSL